MASRTTGPITRLLGTAARGDAVARDKLWATVYEELHRLARAQLARQPQGRSLQPTSLIHQACERLVGKEPVEWANRRRFFATAAEAMRRILADDACYRGRLKRSGGQPPVPFLNEPAVLEQDRLAVLAIAEALQNLRIVRRMGY